RDRLNCEDRAEGLVLKELHRRVDAGDNRRLEEVGAEIRTCAAAAENASAALRGVVEQIAHALNVLRANQRPHVGCRIPTGAKPQALGFFHTKVGETIGDSLFNENPLDRKTYLSAIGVAAPNGGARSNVKIGVGKNQHGVFAAEFEHARNQVASAS